MVLPNTNAGSPSVTPNLGINQPNRDGINANALANTNNANKVMIDTLKGIEAKLGNITNLKTNVQSSIFEAFGNNFMTRSTSALIDGVESALDKFFETPEEVKEDPIVEILKGHTELLTLQKDTSLKLLENSMSSNNKLDADLISVSNIMGEQSKKFDTLIELMTEIFSGALEHSKADDTDPLPTIGEITTNEIPNSFNVTTPSSEIIQNEASVTPEVTKADTPISDIKPTSFVSMEVMNESMNDLENDKKPTKSTQFLSDILKRLTEMAATLKSMSGPLSTQESDLESKRKAEFIGSIKPNTTNASSLLDEAESPAPKSEGNSMVENALGAAGLWATTKGVLSKGKNLVKGIGVGKLSIGGILGGAALDYGSEQLKEAGHEKSAAATSVLSNAVGGASLGATLGSVVPGIGTGIGAAVGGAIGTGVGLWDNRETIFSKSVEPKADEIEQKQKEILETENKKAKESVTIAPTNNTVNNNTTVLPTRTVVKNQEVSYNRYLDSVLA